MQKAKKEIIQNLKIESNALMVENFLKFDFKCLRFSQIYTPRLEPSFVGFITMGNLIFLIFILFSKSITFFFLKQKYLGTSK